MDPVLAKRGERGSKPDRVYVAIRLPENCILWQNRRRPMTTVL